MRCANCNVELEMTDRVWFFKSIVTCSEKCAKEYSTKVMN